MDSSLAFAEDTFGTADLGDARLTSRLVVMASAAAAKPGGTVTSVMRTSAEKEGAFRFLESVRVETDKVSEAMFASVAARCDDFPLVYVPMDQTDLTFVDRKGTRGLGLDNTKQSKERRTTQVMNALALAPDGVPLGMLHQEWWLRDEEKAPHWKADKRPAERRESYNWVRALDACSSRIGRFAPNCRAWYLTDRGSDMAVYLSAALDSGHLFTARATHNRCIEDSRGRSRKLFSTLAKQRIAVTVDIHIPRSGRRRARRAQCEVRYLSTARVRIAGKPVALSAVSIREVGYVPKGQERICWRLLTNHPVNDADSAMVVIRGYALRWRVEEVHRTWKTGGCNIERSQLRSYHALRRWATVLVAVATRIERLKRLSRETPDVDALTEVSQAEIDCAIAYTEDKRWEPGDKMPLKEAVRLIAMVGGYMGRNGDGPPGSITIGRGLDRLGPAVKALEVLGRNG